jgi:hypothetical protein
MNTQKHTDGPWHITKEEKFLTMCTLITVRDSHEGVIAGTHIDAEANARLIAVAPDLLQVTKDFLLLAALHDWEGAAIDFAKATLAKAEGVQ